MRLVAILLMGLAGCHAGQEELTTLKSEAERAGYSLGYKFGQNIDRLLKAQPMPLNPKVVAKGVKDALVGDGGLMTDAEMEEVLTTFNTRRQSEEKANAMQKASEDSKLGLENQSIGAAFLAENKNKPGVTTTSSGLQYRVVKAGTGASPSPSNTVVVHYRGRVIDGTEFDSSYKRGEPATFQLNRVIRGWGEVLQLMKEGAKWEVFIPSELAYGERRQGPHIGPHSVLIFDIELLEVK
jgi:FKBP-type peptidyl-prolyl cis-trans isomerase FklB